MDLAVTITDAARLAGLSRALAAYNTSNPPLTEQEFVQKVVDGQLDAMAKTYVRSTLTKLEFLDRFTAEERIAIRAAAATNGVVKDYLELLNAATEVSLTSVRTVGGVQALEAGELIAAGRAAEILAL
jgi:hypothetical protein